MSEEITCPYCKTCDSIVPVYSGYPIADVGFNYSVYHCDLCDKPFMTKTMFVPQTTVLRLEGIEPPAKAPVIPTEEEAKEEIDEFVHSLPPRTCFKCGQTFNSENPCKWKGEIHCDDCFDLVSNDTKARTTDILEDDVTHPDDEQYHCQECGLLYPMGYKETREDRTMCSSCWATEDNQKAVRDSKPVLEYVNISGNVFAAVSGETVHLQYKDNYLDAWDRTVFETLLDMNDVSRRNEIDKLVEGMTYHQQRRTCLNQVVSALECGEVSFDGGDA